MPGFASWTSPSLLYTLDTAQAAIPPSHTVEVVSPSLDCGKTSGEFHMQSASWAFCLLGEMPDRCQSATCVILEVSGEILQLLILGNHAIPNRITIPVTEKSNPVCDECDYKLI